MLARNGSWRHRLARALTVTLAATLGMLVGAGEALADGTPCQEYVTVFQTTSNGSWTGPGTATYNPGEFSIDTRNTSTKYVTFGGVTRPRRSATFRFLDEAGNVVKTKTTVASGDNWVIRQEPNVIPWDFAQPGQRLQVFADFRTRCGGDDVPATNRYVGSIVTFPAAPVKVNPKYLVVGVTYAPPGRQSFVDYGGSTTLSSRRSFSQSLQGGISQNTELQLGQGRSIASSTSFSQRAQTTISDSIEKTASNNIIIPGPANSLDGIDHNEDLFFVWLNPAYTYTRDSPTSVVTSGYGVDPRDPISPNTDIVVLSVRQLKNPALISPGDASRLQRSWSPTGALTTDDFNAILAHNPFANGGTTIDPARFDLLPGAAFAYTPANPGGQPITQRHSVRLQAASNQSLAFTTQVKVDMTSTTIPSSVTIFEEVLKDTVKTTKTFEASITVTLDETTAANQTTTLSLTGPTTGYQGPTAVQVYQDNLFGTLMFAFAPVATFQIGAPSPNQTVTQGGSAAYPITTQSDFGFTGNVNFSASVMGLPAGAQASFSPASVGVGGGSTLTVTTTPQTPPGTHPLTITASSGLINRHIAVNLVVNPQPFTLTVTPSLRTVSAGQSTTYTITVNPAGGFNGPVQLSGPGGLPPGATATYSPATINGSGSSTLTVTTSASTPAGPRTLTITAAGGGITQTATAGLVVDNTQDFGLTVTPQAAGISAGGTAEYTVTTTAINGFGGFVNLAVSGHPSGSTPSFSVNPIAGAGSSTLRIATTTSTAQGDHLLTITGTSGSLSHSQTVTLTVGPPAADTTPPTVTSTVPAAAAIDVPVATAITVQFSEAMTASTITAGNLELRAGGALVNRSVSYDAASNRATVTPAAALAAATAYTLTVKGGTNGVSDLAGNRMAADDTFSFTTGTVSGGPILGHDQIGTQLDVGDMNYMNGSRFVTGASALTITEAFVYMRSVQAAPSNQYQIAIYTDSAGSPGTLVASTATGTLTANSWNSLPISATLARSTAYWLMYNTNGDNNLSYDTATSGSGAWSANNQTFGTWPATFGEPVMSDFKISIYVR